jgi:isocitrate dehydrogenase kinase/phosphatase
MGDNTTFGAADSGAGAIWEGFDRYRNSFIEISRRAQRRFSNRDWAGIQQDAIERLDLYNQVVLEGVRQLNSLLGPGIKDKSVWKAMKDRYSCLVDGQEDQELGETFFNSTTRRIFATVGVDPDIEFVDSEIKTYGKRSQQPVYRSYPYKGDLPGLLRQVFQDYTLGAAFEDLDRDIESVSHVIVESLENNFPGGPLLGLDFIRPVFYRTKGAYLIGRARFESGYLPLVLSLRHPEKGIVVDAVLLAEKDVSIIFSFTRSYFFVDASRPQELIEFLRTIMPQKRLAELYISIGHNKHGKTELYRDLIGHLQDSEDQFLTARGEKGMVMLVFTLNSYDLVFKVIRDRFLDPKTTTRQQVMDRYQLVFKHDRAGRLVDAQEFEHLRFEKDRFQPALLQDLLEGAPKSVRIEDDYVSIRHLYTERRLTPLNIYLKEASYEDAREAVLDYGWAIKDLAAANIFPGDILLKNFGVTRHRRVVFYDYDELCLLSECRFRSIPSARSFSDDFEAEPWFYVNPDDIFPKEFETFLGLQGELREAFMEAHSDLFEVEFWREMQSRIQSGEIVDIFPYKQSQRLRYKEGKTWD